MRMIPNTPRPRRDGKELRGELDVFEALKKAFSDHKNANSFIAFHSLNLTKHQKKRSAEADFVVLCNKGIFTIEVKGGGVGVDENSNTWYLIFQGKRSKTLKESPFEQAEGAMFALQTDLTNKGLSSRRSPVSYGSAVVFPHIVFKTRSVEWDMNTVCDRNKFKHFEDFLNHLFAYFHKKPHNNHQLSNERIKELSKAIRPSFEKLPTLSEKIERNYDNVVSCTEDQYRWLDLMAVNERVLCYGGAGTGKTFLAAEWARRLSDEGQNVVLVCKSNFLKHYLDAIISAPNVVVSTIDGANVDRKRNSIEKYDVLIVDEGQDLFNFNDMEVLESLVEGGLSDGQWCIFHDINHQSGLFGSVVKEVIEKFIKSYNFSNMPLTTNCRNSMPILKKVQSRLTLDMGTASIGGDGPEVRENKVTANQTLEHALESEIKQLLGKGISTNSITILSPLPFVDSAASRLSGKFAITELDEYAVRSLPIAELSFSEIKNFKGLESEVVILIELGNPRLLHKTGDKVLHYVAMSRARTLLSIFWD